MEDVGGVLFGGGVVIDNEVYGDSRSFAYYRYDYKWRG